MFDAAAYAVAAGAMLVAAASALTLIYTVKHLDPQEQAHTPPQPVPETVAV